MTYFLIAFVLIMGLPLYGALLGLVFYWYETASTPRREKLTQASGGNIPYFLFRLLGRSALEQCLAWLNVPLGYTRFAQQPRSKAGTGPVIIAFHGLYHSPGAWLIFRHWFAKAGYPLFYAPPMATWSTGISALGKQAAEFAEQCARKHPGQPLVLLGHSAGGLLARYALQNPTVLERTAALVTLGTPHRGSRLAAFGFGPAAKGLLYESPESMDAPAPADIPGLCITAEVDIMVLPYQGLLPPENSGWSVEEAPGTGHVGMVAHRAVYRRALEFIESAVATSAPRHPVRGNRTPDGG